MTYGHIVRQGRLCAGMTQKALAHACGRSIPWVVDIEAGRRIPSDRETENISDVTGCDLTVLLRLSHEEYPYKHLWQSKSPLSRRCYIYGLVDPNTLIVKYVGQATNPQRRLYTHITVREKTQNGPSKLHAWIDQLSAVNQKSSITILEITTVETSTERELWWMEHYFDNGLLNGAHMRGIAKKLGRLY